MSICVLLVDDEAELREEIAEFLTSEGMAVSAVRSAEEAVHLIAQQSVGLYQVIVTDVKLPGVDGLSFADSLLADNEEATAVEVIIITGHAHSGTYRETTVSSIFGLISKPLSLAALAATIIQAYESAQSRRRRHSLLAS